MILNPFLFATGGGAAVPLNTVAPALDDTTPVVGQLLGASEGTWDNSPTSFAWLWYRDDVSISVTTETYTVQVEDIGGVLKRRTVASNAGGNSEPVFSDATSAILSNATTFTVNGVAKTNGATVSLANGVTSVTIAATGGSSITTGPTGDSELATGDNECTFSITAADGETVLDVTINLRVLDLGVAEVTSFDFTGLTDVDFATGGVGKYLTVDSSGGLCCVYFSVGNVEEAPSIGGSPTYYRVNFDTESTSAQLAMKLAAKLSDISLFATSTDGSVTTATDNSNGPRTNADAGSSGISVSVVTQGADPS
jgi:hypothetical protein